MLKSVTVLNERGSWECSFPLEPQKDFPDSIQGRRIGRLNNIPSLIRESSLLMEAEEYLPQKVRDFALSFILTTTKSNERARKKIKFSKNWEF